MFFSPFNDFSTWVENLYIQAATGGMSLTTYKIYRDHDIESFKDLIWRPSNMLSLTYNGKKWITYTKGLKSG